MRDDERAADGLTAAGVKKGAGGGAAAELDTGGRGCACVRASVCVRVGGVPCLRENTANLSAAPPTILRSHPGRSRTGAANSGTRGCATLTREVQVSDMRTSPIPPNPCPQNNGKISVSLKLDAYFRTTWPPSAVLIYLCF